MRSSACSRQENAIFLPIFTEPGAPTLAPLCSAVSCVSIPTSNCEMARKQESPKEINRPRPDYLWLVGIQSKEGKRVLVPTASWTVLMSSLKEPTTSPCWRLRRYLLRWCITWRYYIHSERALTARNQGDSDKRCSLAFVLGTSGLAEWY